MNTQNTSGPRTEEDWDRDERIREFESAGGDHDIYQRVELDGKRYGVFRSLADGRLIITRVDTGRNLYITSKPARARILAALWAAIAKSAA